MKSLALVLPGLLFPLLAKAQPAAKTPPATPAPAATTPAPAPSSTPTPAPSSDTLNPAAPAGPRLSMSDAVTRALAIQPAMIVSKAGAEAASARIDETRAAVMPTLSASASASISTHTPFQSASTNVTTGVSAGGDPTVSFDVGARAAWLLTDFGRTKARIRAAEANYQAAQTDITTSSLDIRTNVEGAYLQAVAERELVGVARAAETTALRHLDEAQRFVKAGAQDPITEATADATAASATASRVQAEGAYRTAIAELRLSIGDPSMPDDIALDAGWPTAIEGEDSDRAALVQLAFGHRPELAGARAQLDAAAQSRAAAADGPPAPGRAGGGVGDPINNHNTSQDPVWTASLSLTVPIFDGGLVRAQTREAEASKASAQASLRAEQLTVEHDVESAWIQIKSAAATLTSTLSAVDTAHKQLALAEGRFAQGVGSAVELADAQNAVTNAEGQRVTAEFQLATARTQLRRAMGQ